MASTIPVVRSATPRVPRVKQLQREPINVPPGGFASPTGGTQAFGTPGGRGSPQAGVSVPKAKAPEKGPTVVSSTPQPITGSPTTPSPTVNTTPNPSSPPTVSPTGGTPAPQPVPSSSPGGGGAPQGAPDAGMPNTTIGVTPTAEGVALRAGAQGAYGTAQTEYNQGLANAALNYGTGIAGESNPNSALAIAALRAKQGLETATNNRGSAKTIESSLFGQDKTKISEAHSREDLAAYQKYQLAMQRYQNMIVKARQAYEEGMAKGNLADIQGAERRLPEPGAIEKGTAGTKAKSSKTSGPKAIKQSSQKITSSKGGSVKKLGKIPKAKVK